MKILQTKSLETISIIENIFTAHQARENFQVEITSDFLLKDLKTTLSNIEEVSFSQFTLIGELVHEDNIDVLEQLGYSIVKEEDYMEDGVVGYKKVNIAW